MSNNLNPHLPRYCLLPSCFRSCPLVLLLGNPSSQQLSPTILNTICMWRKYNFKQEAYLEKLTQNILWGILQEHQVRGVINLFPCCRSNKILIKIKVKGQSLVTWKKSECFVHYLQIIGGMTITNFKMQKCIRI